MGNDIIKGFAAGVELAQIGGVKGGVDNPRRRRQLARVGDRFFR